MSEQHHGCHRHPYMHYIIRSIDINYHNGEVRLIFFSCKSRSSPSISTIKPVVIISRTPSGGSHTTPINKCHKHSISERHYEICCILGLTDDSDIPFANLHRIHPNCTPEQVCWPDLQQAFRSVIAGDEGWDVTMDKEWPPLASYITLRLKVEKQRIESTLVGEWRMYCKPKDKESFSYGLIINKVDLGNWTFEGHPRTEGKYTLRNGTIEYTEDSGQLCLRYEEVWPSGKTNYLSARIKSNGKFQCISAAGFEQKATREDLNLPESVQERSGEGAKYKVKKYYLHDSDAVAN